MSKSSSGPSSELSTRPLPGLRPVGGSHTFGGRQGRMSPTRQRAFDDILPRYAATPPYRGRKLILEIGCGRGDTTAAMAGGDADALVVACDPSGAMIANLALLLDERGIGNVRLWVGDVFDLLPHLLPASVSEVRIWFPDPWPKVRQAGKRLITAVRLGLVTDVMAVGGLLRLATDDPNYAAEALAAIEAEPRLSGAVVPRPPERPISVFEARAIRGGRSVTDIAAARRS